MTEEGKCHMLGEEGGGGVEFPPGGSNPSQGVCCFKSILC